MYAEFHMYVCRITYVCMHASMFVLHTYGCMYVCTYVYIYMCVCVYTRVCVYIYVHPHSHTLSLTGGAVSADRCAACWPCGWCPRIGPGVCVCVCVYVCDCNIIYIHAHTHTHTHAHTHTHTHTHIQFSKALYAVNFMYLN
jgi:hypothetical protein